MDGQKLMAATDYAIVYVISHGHTLNLIKLQRLLYMAYAWHLAFTEGKNLFEEHFQAWKFGPVNQTLQHHFNAVINPRAPIHLEHRYHRNPLQALKILNDDEIDHLELIMDVYGDLSAVQLEEMLRHDDPWSAARKGLASDEQSNREITDEMILEYYRERAIL